MYGQKEEYLFEIDFQDFFRSDSVTLKIDKCLVFEDRVIRSNLSDGFADIKIIGYTNTGSESGWVLKEEESEFLCRGENNNVVVEVFLNKDQRFTYLLDVSKGKFLGINKDGKDGILFRQSKTRFFYD